MPRALILSPPERVSHSRALIKDYRDYMSKTPKRTPSQITDVIYLGRKDWFDALSTEDLAYFNKLFEKISLQMDIDPHWNVSIESQLKASDVFNGFLKRVRGLSPDSKKDRARMTRILSEEFGRIFKLKVDTYSLLKAFSGKPQLKAVGERITRELSKMGYAL